MGQSCQRTCRWPGSEAGARQWGFYGAKRRLDRALGRTTTVPKDAERRVVNSIFLPNYWAESIEDPSTDKLSFADGVELDGLRRMS